VEGTTPAQPGTPTRKAQLCQAISTRPIGPSTALRRSDVPLEDGAAVCSALHGPRKTEDHEGSNYAWDGTE
jgi:hypothetical protein